MRKVRAISPVVAVLLLIIVAVAAVLLIYLWMSGFVGKATRTPAEMKTEFKIEAVYLNATERVAKIYIRNTGTTSLDLTALNQSRAVAVYIYDSSTGDLVYVQTDTTAMKITDGNGNKVWEPGELLNITVTDVSGITGGKYYDVKVVIKGVEDVMTYVKAAK